MYGMWLGNILMSLVGKNLQYSLNFTFATVIIIVQNLVQMKTMSPGSHNKLVHMTN